MFSPQIEQAFTRSCLLSLSKSRWLLTLPTLALAGLLIVFCRSLAFHAGAWLSMSLTFFAFFLSLSLLFPLGLLLTKLHQHEAKNLHIPLRRLLLASSEPLLNTTHLSIPPLFLYLVLWIALGFFFLLQAIPGLGPFLTPLLAFAPFLLILASLLLSAATFALLFFGAPLLASTSLKRLPFLKALLTPLKAHPLKSLSLFLLSLTLPLLWGGLLLLAARLTDLSLFADAPPLTASFEWFFLMLPISALLTPAVIFFFNFAAESHAILCGSRS